MDVNEILAQLRRAVEDARALPMSASAVVNRTELLDLVARLEAELPVAFASSDRVVSEREDLVSQAHREAGEIIAAAKDERERILSDTEVFQFAKAEADKEREAAIRECEGLRRDTDDYVDMRLANLEVTLTKTLDAVSRGRDRLRQRSDLDPSTLAAEAEANPLPDFEH